MDKTKIYTYIKIGGILTFIPVVLAAGPIAGFFAGSFIESKVGHAPYISLILITFGFLGSAIETIRIIKFASKYGENG